MAIQPNRDFKNEPTSQEHGTTNSRLEQTIAAPAPLPERAILRSRRLKIPTPDMSQAALEARLVKAVGSWDQDFLNGMLDQLIAAGSLGREADQFEVSFLLSVVEGLKPRDLAEAMLAAQMATVHVAAMTVARRLAHAIEIPQQDCAERAFTKLTRTFVTQLEALARYRTGDCGHTVTVGQVSVGKGGQAIVGNVTQGSHEPASDKVTTSPRPLLTDAEEASMPIIEENRERESSSPKSELPQVPGK